ncbi:MAG: glycoside hydrolase family 43 protein [Acidobacteriaceae bacterium]
MGFRLSKLTMLAVGLLLCQVALAKDAYLFAYFKEPGNQGIYLALSRDGYHFTPLNDGQPWVKPEKPGEIMRDVFLTRGPDHQFHMVWTWNWKGQSLGYAESPDLMHWSAQKEVPIMTGIPATHNVWAPETYWDAAQRKWLLIWSSSMNGSSEGNRIWYSLTPDFKSFTTPKIFFDPGYVVIDATIYRGKKKDYLIFKDQTPDPLRYQVRYATGPTIEGPWSKIQAPLTEPWSEGPSAIKVGKEYVIYYDHYRAPHAQYEGVQSTDWQHWESINDRISFPDHCKHGSFLRITQKEAAILLTRHDAPTAP